MKHTISVLVENEFGVLARVAGMFSAKGYNIDSLSVSETLDATVSRMTIETHGDDRIIEQIIKNLNRLVNVLKVQALTELAHVDRELILVKVPLSAKNQSAVKKIVELHQGVIVDTTPKSYILQFVGDDPKIAAILETLRPIGMTEIVRTGKIGILKGADALK